MSHYVQPRDFRTLFWDFYALYHLWWTYGSGKSHFAGNLDPEVRTSRLAERVDYAFTDVCSLMGAAMVGVMYVNIADEAANAEDDLYADPGRVAAWCEANGMGECVADGFQAPTPADLKRRLPDMQTMARFFTAPFWGDDASGWRRAFGNEHEIGVSIGANGHRQEFAVAGPAWGNLCRLTHNLQQARSRGSLPRLLAACDALLHAHHNTGSIFNRSPVVKRGIKLDKADLDARRDAMGTEAFAGHVSPFVRHLIAALEHPRAVEARLNAA